MSSVSLETTAADLQIVGLDSLRPRELETFFHQELVQWRERLLWDVSGAVAGLRRALDRGGVSGKAVRSGRRTLGYAYFLVEGQRGVVTGLSVASDPPAAGVGPLLVGATIGDLSRRGVSRIESQFVSFDVPWLVPAFEREGFRTHGREFRRLFLVGPRAARERSTPLPSLSWHGWKAWFLSEAALVMQRAHVGGVDAGMNELYRTSEGCRVLLANVLRHGGCGVPIPEASVVARHAGTDRAAGFAVVTETAARHAHLAQLAVAPDFQGKGLGRSLVSQVMGRLCDLGFETLSLMVSRGNVAALRLYRSFGFEPVVRFPVFSRDGIA